MESGTLLHIALLRKTSNAKSKQKNYGNSYSFSKNKKCGSSYHQPEIQYKGSKTGDENFVLSGWSTEESELKVHLKQLKANNLRKLRQSFQQQNNNQLPSSRTNVYTSQGGVRQPRNYWFQRQALHNRSANNSKLVPQEVPHLKQFNSQTCMRSQIKYIKLNHLKNKTERQNSYDYKQKENDSVPQFSRANRSKKFEPVSQRQESKKIFEDYQGQNQKYRHQFTNILNVNNVRARKFFKC